MLVSLFKRLGLKLSLNDPRWGHKPEDDAKRQEGRRPGEGPPDLDQMWRDFNARLNRLFGPRNGGNEPGPGAPRADGRGAGALAGAALAVVVLVWLASGTFTVQDGKIAVVTTFGKNPQKTGAGLNWRWPYPIQSHELVDVSSVRTAEVGYRGNASSKLPDSTMLTDDENIIDIQLTVQYTLKDPIAWAFNNRDQELAVHQLAESAIREVVGRSKMDSVLYEGREKVAIDVSRMMQQMVDSYGLGVLITNVTVQGVQPPEQVQAAFNDAVSAGQDSAKAKNEGEAYANNVIPVARGRAFRLMQDAEAYRSMVVENATGNASRFTSVVTEYQKAPAVTRDRMYLDTMQQIFSNTSKVLMDAKTGNNMVYLPLDKLLAQAAASDARAGTTTTTTTTQVAPTVAGVTPPQETLQTVETVRPRDTRGRDTGRDRESR
ncbi:MAG: FtsH protease activity modulator HflK [Pseudomonadota bacterium]|nr:FtsH protease activity modulator HflK [Pseudomonadota bacterium]